MLIYKVIQKMEIAEKEKIKEKIRNFFAIPFQTLEEKFLKDINRIEALKSNLYESIYENELFCEIYKKHFITKIELKKHNSAGHIVTSHTRVSSVKNNRFNKMKTPSKYQCAQDEILLTPTSNIKSGENSTENTSKHGIIIEKLVLKNAEKNLKDNKDNKKKKNYSPLPSYNKKNKQYSLHLSYIENSKLDNSKAKEDISKSTAISIPKKINNNNRFAHKAASTNNSKLNGSVEIAFSSKTTRPHNIKQKVVENLKTKILSKPNSKKIIISGSILANSAFSNKKVRTLAILCVNAALPLEKRLNLIFNNKELSGKIGILKPLLIESRIKEYERKVILLEARLNMYNNKDEILQSYISKGFLPSKTAQNSLNFLTKEDENNLNKQCNLEQIQNLFKLIYILLNEDYESVSPEDLISNMLTNILIKFKAESIKSLFLNYLIRVFFYSDQQIEKFTSILDQNPKLLSSHELLKISKPLSFLSFIMREIYDYANSKAGDGTSVMILRKLKLKLDHYKLKIQELKQS